MTFYIQVYIALYGSLSLLLSFLSTSLSLLLFSISLPPCSSFGCYHVTDSYTTVTHETLHFATYYYFQCREIAALDEFFDGIQTDPVEIAVVGCGCSVATEPVAEISHRWSIPHVRQLLLYFLVVIPMETPYKWNVKP